MDQREDPVPGRYQTRADLAADQTGGARDKNIQQQGASLLPGLALDRSKGTAARQPGNTP